MQYLSTENALTILFLMCVGSYVVSRFAASRHRKAQSPLLNAARALIGEPMKVRPTRWMALANVLHLAWLASMPVAAISLLLNIIRFAQGR